MKNNRRDFLKKSLIGVSGAAILTGAVKAASSVAEVKNAAIPTRKLGKTGIDIPVLSMGTGDTNNPALIKGALEKGIILYATSSYYGNGNNETMLGKAFEGIPRDSYMIATSAMPKGTDFQNGIFTDPAAADSFRTDIEEGMKRLKVDYLDILFLPFAAKRESVFFEPLLRMMEDFKKQGKAKYLGIATHSFVDQAIIAAADTKIYDVVMAAYNFKLQQVQAVTDAVAYGANAGLGMIAMKTMAGGYWDRERTQPIQSAAALKWVLNNPNIHTMMSGMTTFDELTGNLQMMEDLRLNEQDLKDLKLAVADAQGLYCMQCRQCAGQCPENVDIPTLMRSYMYAYGYRNFHHARQTLDMAMKSKVVCEDCGECKVNCRAGFKVKDKIADIARLKNVPEEFLMA